MTFESNLLWGFKSFAIPVSFPNNSKSTDVERSLYHNQSHHTIHDDNLYDIRPNNCFYPTQARVKNANCHNEWRDNVNINSRCLVEGKRWNINDNRKPSDVGKRENDGAEQSHFHIKSLLQILRNDKSFY